MTNRIDLGQIAAMYPPTKPASVELVGDCTALADLPGAGLPDETEAVAQLLGSAAKIAGHWVALNIMATAAALGRPNAGPLMHPTAWLAVFSTDPLATAFRKSQSAGLCTISEGYAEPTQQLVAMLMAHSVQT